jgi:hypothetical protein
VDSGPNESPTPAPTAIPDHTCDDGIITGSAPPATGGYGTFVFCGGSFAELLEASGCPAATAVLYYNRPDGGFAVWIPGSQVSIVNAEIFSIFRGSVPIPRGTIFTARCV